MDNDGYADYYDDSPTTVRFQTTAEVNCFADDENDSDFE